ncbi:MAG: accessory factor UbiK family protein [Acidiferrobacteraceae bacterium]
MKAGNRFVEQAAALVRDVLPELRHDTEQVLRARLEALFARLDLVTREEFDVQKAVLARTRAQVERLEHEISLLEAGRR